MLRRSGRRQGRGTDRADSPAVACRRGAAAAAIGGRQGPDGTRSDPGMECGFPHCVGPGGVPIFPAIPSSSMTSRLRLPMAGGAQRRFSMVTAPLMPKATAVWLVENTALSFDQVAEFCKLHPLEVKAIADGD